MLKLLSVFILRGRSHLLLFLPLLSGGATGKNPKEHKPRANNRSPTSPLHSTSLHSTFHLTLSPARSLFISRISLSPFHARYSSLSVHRVLLRARIFVRASFTPWNTSPFNTRPRERLSASMEIRDPVSSHSLSLLFSHRFVSFDLISSLARRNSTIKIGCPIGRNRALATITRNN